MTITTQPVGAVLSLRQYPVKSMQGVEVEVAKLGKDGLLGDRARGLVDLADGTVASAKNTKRWPGLFDFRAEYLSPPCRDRPLPGVRITLPDGSLVESEQPDVHRLLSAALGRAVELRAVAPAAPVLQQFWTDETITEEHMAEGTLFDLGPLHLLTTATLKRLRELRPDSDFDPRRFRPNLVIETVSPLAGFVEQGWLGQTLLVGDAVRLRLTSVTGRCVTTTLRQPGLVADVEILRTIARHGAGNVGVYAAVIQEGIVRCGDSVWLEDCGE